MKHLFLGLCATLTLALPLAAHADDTANNMYAPEHCEFSAHFPESPYTTRKCDGGNKDRCYDQVSFTRVFDMRTTVNFRLICNPISTEVRGQYNGEVMKATLKAMTKKSVVSEYSTSYSEEESYKMAGLVGEGKVGRTPTIYIAQLWIGDKSALSVEAELIGDINEPADQLFSSVLRKIGHKATLDKAEKDAEATKSD